MYDSLLLLTMSYWSSVIVMTRVRKLYLRRVALFMSPGNYCIMKSRVDILSVNSR